MRWFVRAPDVAPADDGGAARDPADRGGAPMIPMEAP